MSDASMGELRLPHLKTALRKVAGDIRRTAVRTAWYNLAWRWPALVAGLFLLDLLFGLPVWLRWIALVGQGAFVLVSAGRIVSELKRLRVAEEQAARVVEERHPDVDNMFINAVQFERAVTAAEPSQADLMRRAMSRAEQTATARHYDNSVDRDRELKALRGMAAVLVSWAVVGTVFSGVFMAVMPRLFLPWLDDITPPYSATHFDISPPGAVVRYGEGLTIKVRVSGRLPENLVLVTQSQGEDRRRVRLDSESQDQYSVHLDSLRDDTVFYAQGSTGRSARYRIHVTRPPVVRQLRARYSYPAYSAKPPTAETVLQGGLHGLAGTSAMLEIATNRELAGGVLTVTTTEGVKQQIPVQVDAKTATAGTARLALNRPGEFHLSLTAQDGQTNPDAAHGKIVIEKDQRPSVWFDFPGQDVLVTPNMKVPLKVQAEDDVAVQDVQIHRVINSLGDSPRDFASAPPAHRVGHALMMDMSDLGVRPGDQISYYATAADNAPGTPNVSDSESFTIKVVSAEEFAKALKEQREPADLGQETQDIASTMKDLADRQEALAKEMERLKQQQAQHPNDPNVRTQIAQARQSQQELRQSAKEFARNLQQYSKSPSASTFESALKQKLAQMAQALAATAQGAMQQAQSNSPGQSAASAKSASQALSKLSQQMTAQIQKAIDHLAEILPLYQDMDRFMALLDRQGQLVLKARQFQQKTDLSAADRSRLDQIANEQSLIAQELSELRQDLEKHASDCEAHFPKAAASARRIAAEIGSRGIPQLMESARDEFRQHDGPAGLENARRALDQMNAMVGECRGGQGEACKELDIALSRCLAKPGLGSCLGQFSMQPGNNGSGMGMGGTMSGPSGQQGGGFAARGPKPYVPSMRSADGTGGSKKMQHANSQSGTPAGLSPKEVEFIKSSANAPHKAGDADGSRYPVGYRKLVGKYFKAVAEHR